MRLCSCGFANPDDATHCAACGSALTHESAGGVLLLEEVRSGQVVRVTAPGGILGRAVDFSPDLFSPRVSGVHAVVATNAEGHWTIEHTGRNASAVERGGIWSDLRCGAPQPLFGGETLKLADMVFRVRVGIQEAVAEGATAESDAQDAPAETAWSVRCPVCGTEYAVEGPKSHITTCAFCKDSLDARQIARVAARAVPDR